MAQGNGYMQAVMNNARFISGDRKDEGIWLCPAGVAVLDQWDGSTEKRQEFLDRCVPLVGFRPRMELHPEARPRVGKCLHCKGRKMCEFMRPEAPAPVPDLVGDEQMQDLDESGPDLPLTPEEEDPLQFLPWYPPPESPELLPEPDPLTLPLNPEEELPPQFLPWYPPPESPEPLPEPEPLAEQAEFPLLQPPAQEEDALMWWPGQLEGAEPETLADLVRWEPTWTELESAGGPQAQGWEGWSLRRSEEIWRELEEEMDQADNWVLPETL
ncbi:hypothetical protein ACJ41O_003766 [Fusarium nematophilum]